MKVKIVEERDKLSFQVTAEIDIPDSVSNTETTIFRKDWGIMLTSKYTPKWSIEAEKFNILSNIFAEFSRQTKLMGEKKYTGWKF